MAARLGYEPRARRRSSISIEIIYHDPDVAHRELWVEVQAGAQIEGTRPSVETAVRWTGDTELVRQIAGQRSGLILIGPHDEAMLATVRKSGVGTLIVRGTSGPAK